MKKQLLLIIALVAFTFASCEKQNVTINNYEIEHITVTLDAQKLITKIQSSPLMASTSPLPDQEYKHEFPSTFKAYFVSLEKKGNYNKGEVVKVIDNVKEGGNTIEIPALNYKVIVSNYDFADTSNLLNQNRKQLPKKSKVLYLYGDENIDYSSVTEGTVEVTNDYAALQVFKNEVTPTKGADFFDTSYWYVTYVRNKNGGNTIGTNVKIPVERLNGKINNYNSSQSFPTLEANKVHKIIFTHNVGNGTGGNLNVDVQDDILVEVVEKTVTIN